jgi:hypothetical protein
MKVRSLAPAPRVYRFFSNSMRNVDAAYAVRRKLSCIRAAGIIHNCVQAASFAAVILLLSLTPMMMLDPRRSRKVLPGGADEKSV